MNKSIEINSVLVVVVVYVQVNFLLYAEQKRSKYYFLREFFFSSLHLNEKDKTETPLSLCSLLLAFESSMHRFVVVQNGIEQKKAAKAIYKSE